MENLRQFEPGEITIKEIFLKIIALSRYLRSKWLNVFVAAILGSAVGLCYSYFKSPVFIARTTFVLEEDKSGGNLGSLAGLASISGVDLGGGGGGIFQGDNILELYKSRTMIEKALLTTVQINQTEILLLKRFIDVYGLQDDWAAVPALKTSSKSEHVTELTRGRAQDSLLGNIVSTIRKKCLNVSKPDKKLSVIMVEVSSIDETFAKLFNEQIVKVVNEFYIQTKTQKSLDNISILQQKADSVRSVMNGAIYNAAAVTDATPNLNPSRQMQRTVPVQKSQLNAETNRAILGELVKNLELSKMSLSRETPLIQVVDQPVLPLDINRTGKLIGLTIGGISAMIMTIFCLVSLWIIKRIMT